MIDGKNGALTPETRRLLADYLLYEGVIHGFFALPDVTPEGRRAMEDVGRILRSWARESGGE